MCFLPGPGAHLNAGFQRRDWVWTCVHLDKCLRVCILIQARRRGNSGTWNELRVDWRLSWWYNQRMATLNSPARNLPLSPLDYLPLIIERIVQRFDPVRIILFGSHVRGEARLDSDLDLLVVLPSVTDKRQAAVEIRRALNGVPVSKDIIVT